MRQMAATTRGISLVAAVAVAGCAGPEPEAERFAVVDSAGVLTFQIPR